MDLGRKPVPHFLPCVLLTGFSWVSKSIPSRTSKWLQQRQVRRTGLRYDLGTVFSEGARALLEVAKPGSAADEEDIH